LRFLITALGAIGFDFGVNVGGDFFFGQTALYERLLRLLLTAPEFGFLGRFGDSLGQDVKNELIRSFPFDWATSAMRANRSEGMTMVCSSECVEVGMANALSCNIECCKLNYIPAASGVKNLSPDTHLSSTLIYR
jgi:hypothetical protein